MLCMCCVCCIFHSVNYRFLWIPYEYALMLYLVVRSFPSYYRSLAGFVGYTQRIATLFTAIVS